MSHNKEYHVEPRNISPWNAYVDGERPALKIVTIGVSLTSAYPTGQKFKALLEWAALRFDMIRIDVGDMLQVPSFVAAGYNAEEARQQAQAQGDKWRADHSGILNACPRPHVVFPWILWEFHKDFPQVLSLVQQAAQANPVLFQAFQDDIDQYIGRKEKRGDVFDRKKEAEASLIYYQNEVAAHVIQSRDVKGSFGVRSVRIYPGPELECLRVVRAGLVPEVPSDLSNEFYLQVNFKTRRDLQPHKADNGPVSGGLALESVPSSFFSLPAADANRHRQPVPRQPLRGGQRFRGATNSF